MEQNKNKRLDDLFNQAKNEPSKISFKETAAQFIKSTGSISNVSKGGKLAQFSNLKIFIMITTISAITIGATLLVYNLSEPNNTKISTPITETIKTDSVLIIEEHETVVEEYFDRVEAIKANFPLALLVPKELAIAAKNTSIQHLDTLKKKKSVTRNSSEFEVDTSYRFPHLNYEELKAQEKQLIKMFGKQKKRKIGKEKGGSWYQPDPKGFLFIPMGNITYQKKEFSVQAFYMQQKEVTNLEYRTFLFDLLQQGREDDFLMAKPDQEMWMKEFKVSYNQPMVDNYFSHPAYNDYPVVGMSRKGAEMYCKWFTDKLNRVNQNNINNVRLPTDIEWMYAASAGDKFNPYPWGGPYLRNSNGDFLANFYPMKNNYIADGAFHTAKVDSYNPNDFGLYCMSGNVAEMVYYVDENMLPGTKGGSWTSIGQELQIKEGKDRFKGQVSPSCNIGFRPVITFLGRSNTTNAYQPEITVTPPGTVKLNANLYFDKTEISNFMWKEYVMWQAKTYGKGSDEHRASLPDTMVWKSQLTYNEPYVQYYFNHPAYYNYPVVGISYEQAIAYCKWRTDRVKELFEIQKEKNKKAIYPTHFEYRLPTKQEWERMANIGYSEKMMKKIVGKYKGQSLANYKKENGDDMGTPGNLKVDADVTAPVESYFPNALGCYNLIGNVAEMINEKGIAKGGSWKHGEKEIGIENDLKYSQQNAWLGFRCVFEVKDQQDFMDRVKKR
jgi:formylglycine-generating enzyme required for sulfatase activity